MADCFGVRPIEFRRDPDHLNSIEVCGRRTHVRVFDGNSAVGIADALVFEGEREAAINVVQLFDGDGDVGTVDALVWDGEREAGTNAVQVFHGGDVGTPMDVNAEATGASGELVKSL